MVATPSTHCDILWCVIFGHGCRQEGNRTALPPDLHVVVLCASRVKEQLAELGGGSPFPLFWQDMLTWEHTK